MHSATPQRIPVGDSGNLMGNNDNVFCFYIINTSVPMKLVQVVRARHLHHTQTPLCQWNWYKLWGWDTYITHKHLCANEIGTSCEGETLTSHTDTSVPMKSVQVMRARHLHHTQTPLCQWNWYKMWGRDTYITHKHLCANEIGTSCEGETLISHTDTSVQMKSVQVMRARHLHHT